MNGDFPLVSVVVPIYNVKDYLERCIETIRRQTYKKLEIILIDDGSTDGCGELCDFYQAEDERIRVIHKTNEGLSAARNAGLDLATGEWILFVDSDDFINLYTIEKCLESIHQENWIDIVHFGSTTRTGDGGYTKNPGIARGESVNNRTAVERCLSLSGDIVVWNKLYRSRLFKKQRFPFGKIHEDEFLTYKVLYFAERIQYIDCTLYYHTIRDNSIMETGFSSRKLDLIEAYEERILFFQNQKEAEFAEYSTMQFYLILKNLYADAYAAGYSEEKRKVLEMVKAYADRFLKNRYLHWKHKMILQIFRYMPKIFDMYRILGRR